MKFKFPTAEISAGSWGSGKNSLNAAEEVVIRVYGSEATGSVSQQAGRVATHPIPSRLACVEADVEHICDRDQIHPPRHTPVPYRTSHGSVTRRNSTLFVNGGSVDRPPLEKPTTPGLYACSALSRLMRMCSTQPTRSRQSERSRRLGVARCATETC